MNHKVLSTIAIVVSVLLLAGSFFYFKSASNHLKDLEAEKDSIKIPSKDKFESKLRTDDVRHYEQLVNTKIDNYKKHDLPKKEMNPENTGVMALRSMLSVTSDKVITEDAPQEEYLKHYARYHVDVSNVSAEGDVDGDVKVYFTAKTTVKDGKNTVKKEDDIDMYAFVFNKDEELIGGEAYARN